MTNKSELEENNLPINDVQLNRIKERVKDTIVNSWHYLIPFYCSMKLVLDDKEQFSINERYVEDDESIPDEVDKNGRELVYGISYNGTHIGEMICVTSEYNNGFIEFFNFVKQPLELRKKQKYTILIPDGLIMTSLDQKNRWMNLVAQEIICRLDLEDDSIIYDFPKINCKQAGSLCETEDSISIWNINIGQYELIEIMIPVVMKDDTKGAFIILSDNTVIQNREKELLNKSAVIKEIHHRVKNNMQMIASLLRLQMRRVKSKAVEKAFQESINRISSIALIHEELSKEGLDEINLKETITAIMDMILGNMVSPTKNIKGIIEGNDILINANKASSISLCITELIQNAVEHAFTFRRKGTIVIRIQQEADNNILVSVEDDGIGYNPIKKPSSLGLEIIEMITEETLKGSFKIEGHTYGTKSTIVFPNI